MVKPLNIVKELRLLFGFIRYKIETFLLKYFCEYQRRESYYREIKCSYWESAMRVDEYEKLIRDLEKIISNFQSSIFKREQLIENLKATFEIDRILLKQENEVLWRLLEDKLGD